MRIQYIATSSLLAIMIPSIAFAGIYGKYYDERNQNYSIPEIKPNKSEKTQQPIRFFIGLNASLIDYQNTKITHKASRQSTEVATTHVNYRILNNTAFSFGFTTQYDFRLSFDIQHVKGDTEYGEDSELNATSLGARLDIPFVKDLKTSPFISLGAQYIKTELKDDSDKANLDGMEYYAGIGVTHNFSDNIFGIFSATYGFTQEMSASGLGITCQYDMFNMNLGLGYRF